MLERGHGRLHPEGHGSGCLRHYRALRLARRYEQVDLPPATALLEHVHGLRLFFPPHGRGGLETRLPQGVEGVECVLDENDDADVSRHSRQPAHGECRRAHQCVRHVLERSQRSPGERWETRPPAAHRIHLQHVGIGMHGTALRIEATLPRSALSTMVANETVRHGRFARWSSLTPRSIVLMDCLEKRNFISVSSTACRQPGSVKTAILTG